HCELPRHCLRCAASAWISSKERSITHRPDEAAGRNSSHPLVALLGVRTCAAQNERSGVADASGTAVGSDEPPTSPKDRKTTGYDGAPGSVATGTLARNSGWP